MGNLTRDPELKYTPSGAAVVQFGLAMSERYTNQAGEKVESVCFVDVTVWRDGAEWASKWLKKGREVMVDGKLKLDQWDDQQTGQKRQKLCVTAERLIATGGTWGDKESRTPSEPGPNTNTRTPASGNQRPAAPPQRSKPQQDPDLDAPEDDIPF